MTEALAEVAQVVHAALKIKSVNKNMTCGLKQSAKQALNEKLAN